MPISAIKYAGRYNAYDLAANEVLWQNVPFACGEYDQIISQMQVIRTAGASTGRLLTKWIDANNRTITTQTINVPVTTRWSRFSVVLDVPQNAVACLQAVGGGSTGMTFACAMTDVGDILRAFSYDLSGITSYFGPDGLYTGQVTANQVVILDSNGNVVTTLDSRLLQLLSQTVSYGGVKIDADAGLVCYGKTSDGKEVKVTLSRDKWLRMETDGKLYGGLTTIDGETVSIASVLVNPDNDECKWLVGEGGYSGRAALAGYKKRDGDIFNFFGIQTVANLATVLYAPRRTSNAANDGVGILALSHGDGQVQLNSSSQVATLRWGDTSMVSVGPSGSQMRFGTGANMIILGVDSGGVYKQVGGTKTYW